MLVTRGMLWVFVLAVTIQQTAVAEPWLGVRFAQHCASCHAPGRKNLPPKDRRCSLSCQGCHVNPNGGGLRSYYGKWNEDRIARSFRSKMLGHLRKPAPLKAQRYGKEARKNTKLRNIKSIIRKGYPLIETRNEDISEKLFDNKADYNYKKFARSKKEYVFSIPQHDPYRLMDKHRLEAGADIRTVFNNYTIETGGQTRQSNNYFLMNADFGMQWRPFYRRYHLVYEARMLGGPGSKMLELDKATDNLATNVKTRSLYVLIDDLPYNVFVQTGYYRPLFGNDHADHTALAQKVLAAATNTVGGSYNINYKTTTIGAAPNVPYLNVHMIHKNMGVANPANDKTSGYGFNLGLRGVSFGWSTSYSYYRLKEEVTNVENELQSIMGTFTIWDFVLMLELNSYAKNDPQVAFVRGGVNTVDLKYRMWRENYLTLELASANITKNLGPGSSSQNKVGFRSFVIPGLDLSLQYTLEEDQQQGQDPVKTSGIIGQMHAYF